MKMGDVPGAIVGEGDYIQGDVRVLAGADADATDEKLEPIAHYPGSYVQANGEKLEYKGHVAGIVVEDLGKLLKGKKAGEMLTISTTGPATHEHEKIKNQPITLAIRIDKVERLEPADPATLHTQLGAESLEQLRTRVKEALESRRDRLGDQQAAMHECPLANHLLEKVALELPKGLTGRQTARVLRRRALELSYRGVPQREIESQIAQMRESSEEDANSAAPAVLHPRPGGQGPRRGRLRIRTEWPDRDAGDAAGPPPGEAAAGDAAQRRGRAPLPPDPRAKDARQDPGEGEGNRSRQRSVGHEKRKKRKKEKKAEKKGRSTPPKKKPKPRRRKRRRPRPSP